MTTNGKSNGGNGGGKKAATRSTGSGNRSSMKTSDVGLLIQDRLFVTSCDTKRMKLKTKRVSWRDMPALAD